jgi:hypothetical protein
MRPALQPINLLKCGRTNLARRASGSRKQSIKTLSTERQKTVNDPLIRGPEQQQQRARMQFVTGAVDVVAKIRIADLQIASSLTWNVGLAASHTGLCKRDDCSFYRVAGPKRLTLSVSP